MADDATPNPPNLNPPPSNKEALDICHCAASYLPHRHTANGIEDVKNG